MKSEKNMETMMKYIFLFSSLLSIIAIITICYFIFKGGVPFIFSYGIKDFLFGKTWAPLDTPAQFGILPMITGSLLITALATFIGVPIGVLTATYLALECDDALYKILKPAVNLMAGIPSIVYGFFALTVIVPFIRDIFGGSGMSILTASILLAIMILPTIITMSETAIRSVPKHFYEGSIGLGATHQRSIMKVVLPAAKPGIISSVILGIGRAIGETMAVILVAGNQPRVTGNVLKGIRTLTTNIVLEMGYATGEHREALLATAVVLFTIILIINLLFFIIYKKGEKHG